MLENRLEAVRLYGAIGHRLREECLPFLVDKKYPLSMRWALMTDMDRVGLMSDITAASDVISVFNTNKPRKQLSAYDDFYIDRGNTVAFDSMLDTLTKSERIRSRIIEEEIVEWQEYILAHYGSRGFASFTYDW